MFYENMFVQPCFHPGVRHFEHSESASSDEHPRRLHPVACRPERKLPYRSSHTVSPEDRAICANRIASHWAALPSDIYSAPSRHTAHTAFASLHTRYFSLAMFPAHTSDNKD